MSHHAGTVSVTTSGRTRDEALTRACAHVREATGEQAVTDYSGRQPHWALQDSRCEVIVLHTGTAGGTQETIAGVELAATFGWRDS